MYRVCPLLLLTVWAQPAIAAGDWKLDVMHLKAGPSQAGLVLEETPTEVRFQVIQRSAGKPTVLLPVTFSRASVKSIDRLNARERDELLARLKALSPAGQVEDPRLKGLELRAAFLESATSGRRNGLHYVSDHFELVSDASEDIVRRAALWLEEVYAAYALYLPPVGRPAKPNTTTIIYLYQTLGEYQARLKRKGRNIYNPAYFDATDNEIIAAGDLQPLAKQFADVRRTHQELLDRLKVQEAEVNRLPKGEVQTRGREQLRQARHDIVEAGRRNEELFRTATRTLFRSLFHEAFHAYLANFVFPPTRGEVPRWLNEGLAQVFEEAVIEGGELRVGHVEAARLEKAQAAVKAGELTPLGELLRSTPAVFVVAHGQDRRAADRYYLTSWALAHYLLFERRLAGTAALDEYLVSLNGKIDSRTGARTAGADAVDALGKLAGQSLAQLEEDLRQYVLRLQADGSAPK